MKTVLVMNDVPEEFLLVQMAARKLQTPVQFRWVRDYFEAWAYLHGHGCFRSRQRYPFPTAALVDVQLRSVTGREVLAAMRRSSSRNVARLRCLLLCHARPEPDLARQIGADDFALKAPLLHRPLTFLRNFLAVFCGRENYPCSGSAVLGWEEAPAESD